MAEEALIWETQPLLDSILILCKAAAGRTKSNRRPLDNDLLQTAPRPHSSAAQAALTAWSTTWIPVCICWRSSLCCFSVCSANLSLSKSGKLDFKRNFSSNYSDWWIVIITNLIFRDIMLILSIGKKVKGFINLLVEANLNPTSLLQLDFCQVVNQRLLFRSC